MTERPEPEFDENAARPESPGDTTASPADPQPERPGTPSASPPEPPAAGSGVSPQRAEGPRFDWPDRPHAGQPEEPTNPVDSPFAPPSGASRAEGSLGGPPRPIRPIAGASAFRWPDRPTESDDDVDSARLTHLPSEEVTSVVDLSKTNAREALQRRRGDVAPPPPAGAPAWRAQNDRYGRPPALPAQQQPYSPPEFHHQPPLPAPAPGGEQAPIPHWQQPPAQTETAAADEAHGWSQAQGSGPRYNYTDNIRSSELLPSKRIPPTRGWRKVLYRGTFKLINPGQSRDEREQDDLQRQIQSLLRGKYKIGVLGKGGVGKSTISASVGSVFADLRKEDRVVAIDADTAFGKLASRIDPDVSGSYWELAADQHLDSFADIRGRLGSNKAGLYVLGGESATARRRVLDSAIYQAATYQLDRHFTLSIVDCGSTLDSPVTRAVLNDLDALIVVSSPWWDGASAAGQTMEWLANEGYTSLLNRTVVVLNDSDGHSPKRDRALLVERFSKGGQKVIELPFDEHLRPGGVIDLVEDVNRNTYRALLKVAAACAEHFAATTDAPRGTRQ